MSHPYLVPAAAGALAISLIAALEARGKANARASGAGNRPEQSARLDPPRLYHTGNTFTVELVRVRF